MRSRAAGPGDLDLLAAMNARLIRDEGHPNPMDGGSLRARMAGWLDTGAWRIDLFETAGEVVGYAAFRRERDDARPQGERLFVRQFFIRPEHRRRGFGRRAFGHLVERRGRPGIPVRIEVLTSNAAGRSFWAALGFRDHAATMEWQAPEA